MRSRVRGWRWRRSPLRRRSDVVEAWTVLAVTVLLLVVAPLLGMVAAWWAQDSARATAREQRAERHPVRAEVVGRTSDALSTAHGGRQPSNRVTVHWTEPDGAPRTATARVPAGTRTGETVEVWFDSRGRSVAPPADDRAVWQHTVTVGVCATGGAVAVILFGHGLVRHAAMRRRLAEWEQEWARTEPAWTGRRA
ncbi:hypothetical protein J7F01_13410 [Streptomyces sp. ISL-22]|uniref:Rv1733c family protein n=1 Tax=unclassified Streptomyces TaxID=2593676 RepID=UPI001BE6B05E|nr:MULTISPECIES: DUF3592 domain-containing protein [unclassified Streptomyces]MBT2420215.1 hypothetical protein [Streptomyces sp. ISL-24]MBT2433171.1 hypothetical protein [Streptomyces sp. ISL-22]